MLNDMVEVIREGDDNGNHMLIRFSLPSGIEILGLPTENAYGGGWDLGPTWNYAVLADKRFMVDAGKTGMGEDLLESLAHVGVSPHDLDSIVLSHGHEDHDGGLPEIVDSTGIKVKAHRIYNRLIRFYPEHAPADVNASFPASCWRCNMPESFSTVHCREYHQRRSTLMIDEIGDAPHHLGESTIVYHVPGHSPDALAFMIEEEVLIVGDTVLPQITPIPSREAFFEQVREVLKPDYTRAGSVYGLLAFIKSLKKLAQVGNQFPDLLVLPAHRLYYDKQWNEMMLGERVHELIGHHVDRCADILRLLRDGPKTAKEIASEHFEERLLKGLGMLMAENEILSHCELLMASGDMVSAEGAKYAATGSTHFESVIRSL